ncbi:tripartite tricarboxylate transporter permease [Halalkalicoccus sp. GCM10025322]|uniref:tripartite tricarboxylate transporter permease n=1 Tax=Halalkalicoccus TaxID=332246 RepID=UPI002F961BC2
MGEIIIGELLTASVLDGLSGYFGWLFENVSYAASIVARNWYYLLLGVIGGMLIGIIPGMGGVVVLTILLPFTLVLDQFQAFVMLSGGLGACTFAGSMTAILINTPGTASNAATLIDGYPLTQKGKAVTAITISAVSSASGAVLATSIFIIAIPLMIEIVLLFGPGQIFWIILWALLIIPFVVADRPLYGVLTGSFGGLVALIGTAPQTAEPRYTFGIVILYDGLELAAMLIGLFAIAEIVRISSLDRNTIVDFDRVDMAGSKAEGIAEVLNHKWLWFKSSIIGLVTGAIPGAGGSAAAFVAYAHAAQSSQNKDEFGKGAVEGIIAPESANDAKDGGQLFPTLGLGIPGSGSTAVFLGALLMHGIFPGPNLLTDEVHLVLVIAISLLMANILTSVIGLIVATKVTYILQVPIPLLLTGITVLALTAVFILRNSVADLWIALIFAVIGVVFTYLKISRIPFLIAFVLASILEHNYHLAMRFAAGSANDAFFSGTLNMVLLVCFALSIFFLVIPRQRVLDSLM